MIENLVIIFYCFWAVALLLFQFKRKTVKRFKRFDILGLVPGFKLFALNPLKHDTYLFYRERHNAVISEFKDIGLLFQKTPLPFLYNPHQRLKTPFINVVASLATNKARTLTMEQHLTSFGYIFLLSLAMRNPPAAGIERQFVLIASVGADDNFEPQILMSSGFHEFK